MTHVHRRLATLAPVLAALAAPGAALARRAEVPDGGLDSGPAKVPCHAIGGGRYDCGFYPPGNGIGAGAPVQAADGHRVGFLNQGTNWVICERSGGTLTSGPDKNDWWAWTEANDRQYGWVNALYARGGANFGAFAGVPLCGPSTGSPPGGATASPPPRPGPVGDLIASVSWRKTDASSSRYPSLKGWTLVITPQQLCRTVCSGRRRADGWAQVVRGVSALAAPPGAPAALSHSMYQQYVCHTIAGKHKSTWDLDAYRPDASLARELAQACNPPNGSAISVIEGR